MGKYLYYIIAIVTAGLMFLTYFFINKKAKNKIALTHKIVAWVIFALMFVWLLLSGGGYLRNTLKLAGNSPFKEINTLFGVEGTTLLTILAVWAFNIVHIAAIVASMFKFKIIHRLERIVSPVLTLFVLLMTPYILFSYTMSYDISWMGVLFTVELGIIIGKLIYLYVFDFDKSIYKMSRWEIVEFVLCTLGAILFTMFSYFPQAFFGNLHQYSGVKDFDSYHRYYIYATFIFLIGMSLLLRNHKGEYSRMVLFYIAMGGMISFSFGYSFNIFVTPYRWPLHICNTAMYILPIALLTKSEKVFYFTFFVNILGAFLALLMPNYSVGENLLSNRVVGFYINHIEAMAMPFVCVLTGVFQRPKQRQFFYSMVGFAIYYVLAIVFNTWFSAIWPKEEVDFFFINSDFVAKKVNMGFLLDNFKFTFTINGRDFTMYPLYQVIYFFGFVILSIGMWYVYAWVFMFQDYLIYLNERSKKIKFDELALKTKYGQKEVNKCMNPETVDKLVISHFGKRYSEKSPFAVRDINFEAHAGEIIGFLGPNGAGKSTTIKAIVGIHLPTEGKIEVNGYDVAVQPVLAKSQIGFVPDHYALYENLTGREYLNYIADLYDVSEKDRTEFLNKFLDLLVMKDAIDNKIQTYSHGMKQKIAIMASIIHNPKVWILDEPLTGLDPVSIFQVKQCLKKHAENGNIVFFSSHLIDIVEKLCDRILIISNHQVVDVADVKKLLDKNVNLEAYYMEKTGLATGN